MIVTNYYLIVFNSPSKLLFYANYTLRDWLLPTPLTLLFIHETRCEFSYTANVLKACESHTAHTILSPLYILPQSDSEKAIIRSQWNVIKFLNAVTIMLFISKPW